LIPTLEIVKLEKRFLILNKRKKLSHN
jgi:hypothetical protein